VTGNKHKVQEAQNILEKYNIKISVKPLELEKIEIQSDSLEEIVRFAVNWIIERNNKCNFFLEDAGLFVDALNGFPGPYSSYVLKTISYDGILKLMEGIEDRSAKFQSVIGLCFENEVRIFKGEVHGRISHEARGNKGFGFDPIFIPNGYSKTFAEMDLELKNSMSHRGKSIKKMAEYLKKKGF